MMTKISCHFSSGYPQKSLLDDNFNSVHSINFRILAKTNPQMSETKAPTYGVSHRPAIFLDDDRVHVQRNDSDPFRAHHLLDQIVPYATLWSTHLSVEFLVDHFYDF